MYIQLIIYLSILQIIMKSLELNSEVKINEQNWPSVFFFQLTKSPDSVHQWCFKIKLNMHDLVVKNNFKMFALETFYGPRFLLVCNQWSISGSGIRQPCQVKRCGDPRRELVCSFSETSMLPGFTTGRWTWRILIEAYLAQKCKLKKNVFFSF